MNYADLPYETFYKKGKNRVRSGGGLIAYRVAFHIKPFGPQELVTTPKLSGARRKAQRCCTAAATRSCLDSLSQSKAASDCCRCALSFARSFSSFFLCFSTRFLNACSVFSFL